MIVSETICNKCENRVGFVNGTCIKCGWNHLESQCRTIRVDTDYLPLATRHQLIKMHEERVERGRRL